MDMVQADAAREPLQHGREHEVRAAVQRRGRVVPLVAGLPVCILELVLHVEQPHAGHRREVEGGQIDERHHLPAEQQDECGAERQDARVRRPHALHLR